MLYEFKLSHSAAEAARNIALAFVTDSPSERTVGCWLAKFSSGDFDLEDKPGRGRRMSLDDQALRAAVKTKPDTTTRTEHVEIAFQEFLKSCDLIFYCKGVNELPDRWQRCVESEGFYFDE
ncbi:hypothetical protein Y032_0060g3182 [Ancylostoma ceylanicum]|nr:hypothetical protein Y032_0060g3182 [Ancylostoma ceylanicum]